MSRLGKKLENIKESKKMQLDKTVENFMGGLNYELDPLESLKLIAASSIFGEPAYYRTGDNIKREKDYHTDILIEDDCIMSDEYDGMSTTEIFTRAIDNALDYNFEEVLKFAVYLRNEYLMRLNPQVIMVRASLHPKRAEWSKANPGKFNEYQNLVMLRGDEPAVQLTYYLSINDGDKANIPSILKRSIANKLSSLSLYQINKYKNYEIGMINATRLTHAHSPELDELMKTGTVKCEDNVATWQQKRSIGCSWEKIIFTIPLGHMAMLMNIRNIFTEINDFDICEGFMESLKEGVPNGKLFPFRYESAYRAVKSTMINHKQYILDSLEDCIDISIDNLPRLKGKTACLSDNSGSAWGAFTCEYGTVKIANIDNLSSVIAARCSDEGQVIKFGDNYKVFDVSHRNILAQAEAISADKYDDVGGSTESGIWKFMDHIISNKIKYDNIFIYSDQQAGTGNLYGTYEDRNGPNGYRTKYGSVCVNKDSRYINVYKLITIYREKVNPKVNVFSIQTAGYTDMVIPQMAYRCAILTGWTGKEILYASEYIKQWDEIENNKNNNSSN